MGKCEIKWVLDMVEELGGDPKDVVLLVPAKRGRVAEREDLLEAIAATQRGPVSKMRSQLKGYEVGMYVRGENLVRGEHYQFDGDGCLYLPGDGNSYHSGEIVIARTSDLRMKDAMFMDMNMETHTDENRAVKDAMELVSGRSRRY
jgi:hypothetical protein